MYFDDSSCLYWHNIPSVGGVVAGRNKYDPLGTVAPGTATASSTNISVIPSRSIPTSRWAGPLGDGGGACV